MIFPHLPTSHIMDVQVAHLASGSYSYVLCVSRMPLAVQACSRRSMTAGVNSEGSLARSAAQMTSLSSRSYVCDAA
jgi:hypothetical protein